MSVGIYVWIGVDFEKSYIDEDFAYPETVANSEELCQRRIDATGKMLTPVPRLLILKGKMK